MIRNFLIFAIAALTLSACTMTGSESAQRTAPSAAATAAATPDVVKLGAAVTDKEKAVWEALKNKQFDEARKAWADDYTGVYDIGIHTADQELADVRKLDLKSYTLSDIKTTIPNRETAVITYKATMKASYQGKDISGVLNVASVWRERNGDWQTLLHTDMKAQ